MVTFWAYLRFQILLWALRATWRVFRWAVITAALIIAAPVSVVALWRSLARGCEGGRPRSCAPGATVTP